MKTKLFKTGFWRMLPIIMAWVFVSATYAQKGTGYCYNSIPGLTDQQKSKIEALHVSHQKDMEALRTQKQAASANDKGKFTQQMTAKRTAHHNEIRNLLNDEQKKAFDQYVTNGGCGKANGEGKGKGCGNGNGNGCGGCSKK
jgi:hypothetical protein